MKAAAQAPAGSWLVLIVTLAIQAMAAMAVLTVPAIAPAFAERLGASVSLLGIFVALVYGAAMLSTLLAGQAVRRMGAIRVSQVSLFVCMVGLCLLLLPSLWAVAAGAFFIGLGYGPITPASSHLLAASTPPQRVNLVFSIKQTGVPLGGMLAGVIAPPLTLRAGPYAAILLVAFLCLLFAGLAQPLRRAHDADRVANAPIRAGGLLRPLRLVLEESRLRRLAGTSFVFSGVQLCMSGYLVTYLHSELGYSLIAAGIAMSVAQVAGVVGRIVWGHIADRFLGANRSLLALALIMIGSTVATGLLTAGAPQALILALALCFGVSATGWNGVYLAAVARLAPPGMAGMATGGTLSITYFGAVAVPAAFGLLGESLGGFGIGYVLLAVPLLACSLVHFKDARAEATGRAA